MCNVVGCTCTLFILFRPVYEFLGTNRVCTVVTIMRLFPPCFPWGSDQTGRYKKISIVITPYIQKSELLIINVIQNNQIGFSLEVMF